jgi:hypothetical protein
LHLASDPVRLRQAATAFAREGDRWVGSLLTDDAVLAMPENRHGSAAGGAA